MIEDDDNVRRFAVQVPINADVETRYEERGEVVAQVVKTANVAVEGEGILRVRVDFDAT